MAMSYQDTNALTQDTVFCGRVSVACVHFADYITGEDPSTPAHSTRYRWAQQTLMAPQSAVTQCINTVVNDPNVQAAGGAPISDSDLQTVVETAVNKLL